MLLPYVKGIKYFSEKPEINENDYLFICEHVRYEFFPEGKNVIQVGEYGDKFYVIIEGEVQVLVPQKKKGTEEKSRNAADEAKTPTQ